MKRAPDFTFAALLCAYESLAKGWLSFMLVPATVVVLGLEYVLWVLVRRRLSMESARNLRLLAHAQLVSLVLFYVCVPGVGDTKEMLLFGFLTSSSDTLATVSEAGMFTFGAAAVVLAVALVVTVIVRREKQSLPSGSDAKIAAK